MRTAAGSATLLATGFGALIALNAWVLPRTIAPTGSSGTGAAAPGPSPTLAGQTWIALPPPPPRRELVEVGPPRPTVIRFETGQYTLGPEGLRALERLAARGVRGRLLVEGHADRTGESDYNLRLSWLRAEAVAQRLDQLGWPAGRLTVTAHGATRPAMTGRGAEALRHNRRVELSEGVEP